MKTNIHLRREKNSGFPHSSNKRLAVTAGIWIEGKTYWVRNHYERIIAEEGISIRMKEVPIHSQINYLDIFVRNHKYKNRKVKILLKHHYPYPTEEHFTFVSPVEKVVFHTVNDQIYLVSARGNRKGIEQMTVLPHWHVNTEQIWRSIEKGILNYQPMAKGMMVSILSIDLEIPAREMRKGSSWVIKGQNKGELLQLNKVLLKTH